MFTFDPVSLLTPALFIGLLSTSIGLASSPAAAPRMLPDTTSHQGTVIVHDTRVRLTEGQVEVTDDAPAPSGVASGNERHLDSELAQRFIHALTTPAVVTAARSHASRTATAQPSKTWTCGQWQTLWQGRGQGRTCEFK